MELLDFRKGGGGAAVDLDDEMGVAGREDVGTELVAGGGEGEAVGDFEGGGEMAGVEHRLHGGGGHFKFGENGGEHRAARGFGNQAEGCFRDNA